MMRQRKRIPIGICVLVTMVLLTWFTELRQTRMPPPSSSWTPQEGAVIRGKEEYHHHHQGGEHHYHHKSTGEGGEPKHDPGTVVVIGTGGSSPSSSRTTRDRAHDHHHLDPSRPVWIYTRYSFDWYNNNNNNQSAASITSHTSVKNPIESQVVVTAGQEQRKGIVGSSVDTTSSTTTEQQTTTTTTTKKKGVIVQYAGAGNDYMKMLNMSLVCSHAYARHWRDDWDVVELRGILPLYPRFSPALSKKKTVDPALATYNKAAILSHLVVQYDLHYDYVLVLDADAVIVDQNFNLLQWVQQIEVDDTKDDAASSRSKTTLPTTTTTSHMIYAHRVMANDSVHTWNVNIGVTLWNLRHPKLRSILRKWKFRCKRRQWLKLAHDDQRPLQAILKQQQEQYKKAPH